MPRTLEDKIALVTGGAQGLGEAICHRLALEGAHVVVADLNIDGAQQVAADITAQTGRRSLAVKVNITDEADVAAAVQRTVAEFGRLDIAVSNAGILIAEAVDEFPVEKWRAVIDVNLTGVFLCTREVAAKMIELDNQGAIVNISSISRAGNMGQANYSAAKAGVAADTVVWAKELARYGIRVAGVAPGFIETEMTGSMKPEALEKMTSGIPLRRMGKPAEIAHSVAYIMENDYYTGRILELDGGLRL